MFNSITGIITGKFSRQLFLDNNGIEWDICVPDSNLELLPPVGNEARVYTWLQHAENLMSLYGFSSADERSVFLDLLKVEGVGPKGAVKIMSAVSSGRLNDVLERGDVEMLEKIPGVGKKTAAKMMLALKGKLRISGDGGEAAGVGAKSPYSDVIASLVSMGYDRRLAQQKISQLAKELASGGDFSSRPQNEKEDLIFRRAIVELS